MLELPNRLPTPQTQDPEERLFRHSKYPEWGIGLWVKEEPTRRRLVFEDGERRAFKKGYYQLLDAVDADECDVSRLVESLVAEDEAIRDEAQQSKAAPVMSFDNQVRVFLHLFPGGFEGEAWKAAYREPSSGEPGTKHLDASVKLASKTLNKTHMGQAIKAKEYQQLYEDALEVLQSTTLVPPATLRGVKKLEGPAVEAFVRALYDLLHGKTKLRSRFEGWLAALSELGAAPDWQLATALMALVYPDTQVYVRRTVLDQQAREVTPRRSVGAPRTARNYRSARHVALTVSARLEKAGHPPADLLDVQAFVWETLRTNGRRTLEEL